MRGLRGRILVIVAVIAVFSAIDLGLERASQPSRTVDISLLPLSVGSWTGNEVPVGRDVKEILQTDSVLLREYTGIAGARVGLALVYYADPESVAFHLPESCLMGRGSRLAGRGSELISAGGGTFSATRLITESGSGKDAIIYYFQASGYRTASYLDFRTVMLANQIRHKRGGGALVRVSTGIPQGGTEDEAIGTLHEFLKEFAGVFDELLP